MTYLIALLLTVFSSFGPVSQPQNPNPETPGIYATDGQVIIEDLTAN